MEPEPLQVEFEAKFMVRLLREHHATNNIQYVLFMCRQKYQTHFTAFHSLTCFWDDLRPKTGLRLFCCKSLRSSWAIPSLCLLQGRGKPNTWTADAHRMPTACKQYGHTAHKLPVTHCVHSNSSHEILVTPIVLPFFLKSYEALLQLILQEDYIKLLRVLISAEQTQFFNIYIYI